MPTPAILDALTTEVTDAITVMDDATTLILGFNNRLTPAVAAALANGATAEQLAPIQSEIDAAAAAAVTAAAAVDADLKALHAAVDAAAAAVATVPPPPPPCRRAAVPPVTPSV
jgi:hypothetical protein